MKEDKLNSIIHGDPLVMQPEVNNPYRVALGYIWNRIFWDLRLSSWVSRSRLKRKKGGMSGKKAVILCNGPSLLAVDFNKLAEAGVFTFGLNKINLLFESVDYKPNCIVAVNKFVIEQNADFFNATDIDLYLDYVARKKCIVKPKENIIYLHSSGVPKFAKDVSLSVQQGHTVTFVAMQLAFHMGFSEVALVGADHSFAEKGPANKVVVSSDVDKSHFSPDYFSKGVSWQLPDLYESEVWYGRARLVYEAHGRKIYNCTEGGLLEVFQRTTIDRFLQNSSDC